MHAREKGFLQTSFDTSRTPQILLYPSYQTEYNPITGGERNNCLFPGCQSAFLSVLSFVRASPLFFYERWSKQDPKPPFIPFGKTPPPTEVRDTLSSAESLVRRMTIFFVHLVERGKEGGPGKKKGLRN